MGDKRGGGKTGGGLRDAVVLAARHLTGVYDACFDLKRARVSEGGCLLAFRQQHPGRVSPPPPPPKIL